MKNPHEEFVVLVFFGDDVRKAKAKDLRWSMRGDLKTPDMQINAALDELNKSLKPMTALAIHSASEQTVFSISATDAKTIDRDTLVTRLRGNCINFYRRWCMNRD